MSSIEDVIRQKFLQQGRDDLADTWTEITAMYSKGGPELVEMSLLQRAREIRMKFTREVKEIETGRSIVRVKKLARRRR